MLSWREGAADTKEHVGKNSKFVFNGTNEASRFIGYGQ